MNMVFPQRFRQRIMFEKDCSKHFPVVQSSQNALGDSHISALALHKPHKLQEIPEVFGSSRTTLLGKHNSRRIPAFDSHGEVSSSTAEPDREPLKNVDIMSELHSATGQHTLPAIPRPSDLESLSPSTLSLPLNTIPRRRSSMTVLNSGLRTTHYGSLQELQLDSSTNTNLVWSKGRARSPVRHVVEKGPQSSEALRASPSRTFIRTTTPYYLLDNDESRNPRVGMSVRLPSSSFIGGGTVEGQVELRIEATSGKKIASEPLYISRLSVDIVGVEEIEDGRRWIFLTLATELFDSRHPPPSTLVHSQTPEKGSELYWQTRPATATIPFCINLPLKLGPPPYSSKQASIRYFLCPSAIIKIGDKRSAVRQKWSVQMLTVHDPEKALASLPSPLLATDTLMLNHTPVVNSVKLTAGLHRQTWVSGSVIFTDIHVFNGTDKMLKRIELRLEKSTLWFSHSAAGTIEKRSNNLRLPAKIDTEPVSKYVIKKGRAWSGIAPQAAEVRTCELEIPKAHITVGNGRFFEVRYFVKVVIAVGRKSVSVQLPVSLIHLNSLDIMPNSVAQVAVAIEAKRAMNTNALVGRAPHQKHTQGQAFTAACRKTLENTSSISGNVGVDATKHLSQDADGTPRPHIRQYTHEPNHNTNMSPPTRKENFEQRASSCYRHLESHPSCYHCHLLHAEHAAKHTPQKGPKLPRLQVSTSGLGFSESEFELPPDSPRKVMLSEVERQMINQERELKLQRQLSQQRNSKSSLGRKNSKAGSGFMGWRNVALPPGRERNKAIQSQDEQAPPTRRLDQYRSRGRSHRKSLPPVSARKRSKTQPEGLRASFGDNASTRRTAAQARGMRSLDQGYRHPWSSVSLAEDDVFAPPKTSNEQPRRSSGVNLDQR